MKEIFGSAVNSLSSVQKAIEDRLGEKSAVLYNSKKTYSSKKILLIPNINALRSGIKNLQEWNGVCIVFDSPINLHSISKLRWLDVKRNEDVLSYKFDFVEPKYSELFKAYESTGKKNIKIKKQNILRALVISRSDTHFLEKWNNFLYFCTSHVNREFCKKLLLDYFNDKLTMSKFATEITACLRENQVEYYLKEMLNWLKSADGLQLKAAWKNVKDKDEVQKVAKKMNVELADMRYLQRITRSIKTGD